MPLLENVINDSGLQYKYNKEIFDIHVNDPENGYKILSTYIEEIEIFENLFTLLPTINIMFNNSGNVFNEFNIKPGDILYVNIKHDEDEDVDLIPYINSQFVVQSIYTVPFKNENRYNYFLTGIFNAQTYLNTVASYPKTDILSLNNPVTHTSVDAIQEVLDDTTLKFIPKCKSNDLSLWINGTLTRAQFIDKIIEHAWIDLDDAPILYTDINGNTYYSSIKTLSQQPNLINAVNIQYYINNITEYSEKNEIIYNQIQYLNGSGPILDNGGYKVNGNLYNPYNSLEINDEDIEIIDKDFYDMINELLLNSSDIDVSTFLIGQLIDKITKGNQRKAEYTQDETYIASISNKNPALMNTLNKNKNVGMYFKDFHNHYDLAPLHNEMIRRNFFQNFVFFIIDVHRQTGLYQNNKCRPKLGDKIYIDFSSVDIINKIQTGNYIVCGKEHYFYPNSTSYSIKMICVNDGTFHRGSMEK